MPNKQKTTGEMTPQEMMALLQGNSIPMKDGKVDPVYAIGRGISALGAGLSGFSAPFLGQQWKNPYAQANKFQSPMEAMAMMMVMQQMGQAAAGDDVTPPTKAPAISPEDIPSVDAIKPPRLAFKPTGTAFDPRDIAGIDIAKTKAVERVKAENKWTKEDVDRQIKFDVLTPKLANYMEVGGRAYQELRDTAKRFGINLNFEKGGLSALIAAGTKNVAIRTKLAPLMVALERLRPELGTELMRQLGAFRSAAMAQRFAATLAQFSGDIREDIANMSTTITKNKANTVLLDAAGNPLSNEARNKKMDSFEANLIRKYNVMYRGMGLMTKPYTAQRSFEWLAKNSTFNKAEKAIIQNAQQDNPKYDRVKIIAKLIERGLL